MNKRLFFFTILVILVFSSFGNALAQTQEIGVKVGNEFFYHVSESADGQSNNWTIGIKVNSVSGSLISVTDIEVFENGTRDAEYQYTYEVSNSSINPYFFFANLSVNDPVYVTEEGTISVNKTINRSYASGNRETNYIMYDLTEENVIIETYFDKQTGVLVESIQKHPPTDYEIHATLTDTNVWLVTEESASPSPIEPSQTATESPSPTPSVQTPSPFTSITPTPESKPGIFLTFETLYVIIAVIVVVVAVAVLAVALKRRKNRLRE
jgi:hypothetical protein